MKIHTPDPQNDQPEAPPGATEPSRLEQYRDLIVETDRLERSTAELALRNKAMLEAAKAGVFDPTIAAALIPLDAIVFDNGEPKNVLEQLDLILEQRPWLKGEAPKAPPSDKPDPRFLKARAEARATDGVIRFKRRPMRIA